MLHLKKNKRKTKTDEAEIPETNKGKRFKIGSALIIVFLLLYLPSLYHWLSKDNVNSDILRIGTIEQSVNSEGLLVRDEVLLPPAPKDGKFIPEVAEGERIPSLRRVATISDKASLQLLQQLEAVNEKIIKAQTEKAKKADFFSEDMAKIDEVIGQRVQDIITECNSNNLLNLSQLKTEVDRQIERKAAIAGGDEGDTFINSLKQEKNSIQQQINSNTSQVTSNYSGIVSYVIDGYEQSLTPDSIDKLTPEVIDGIKEKNLNEAAGFEEIHAGKPFIKVIRSNNTYIATVLDAGKAAIFKADDIIKVRLNDIGAVVQATVTGISEKGSGKYIMTVRIDRYAEELSSLRKINADFIKNSFEGLKIPLQSLYSNDSGWKKAKLMLIKANCATEREVEVLCRDNEYAIIKSPENEVKNTVSLYDTYILNPGNIKEGQIVEK